LFLSQAALIVSIGAMALHDPSRSLSLLALNALLIGAS
jgi:hypothetical protein